MWNLILMFINFGTALLVAAWEAIPEYECDEG